MALELDRVCLVRCGDLTIDLIARTCAIGGETLHEGDEITHDGNDRAIYGGRLSSATERLAAELAVIDGWRTTRSQR